MFHLYNTVQDSNNKDISPRISSDEYIGISTGNWGCGAFGGNPEIKSMIQWIAASQVQEKSMLGLAVHVTHVCFHLNATTDWCIYGHDRSSQFNFYAFCDCNLNILDFAGAPAFCELLHFWGRISGKTRGGTIHPFTYLPSRVKKVGP